MIEPLKDTDTMPFGKYGSSGDEGPRAMQDVPVRYLHYLWTKGFREIRAETEPTKPHQIDSYRVAMYIRNNLSALKMEDEDLIWS